jgi:hypothetical protein
MMIKTKDIKEGARVEACGLEGIDDGTIGEVKFDRRLGYYVTFGLYNVPLEVLRTGDEYLGIKQAD